MRWCRKAVLALEQRQEALLLVARARLVDFANVDITKHVRMMPEDWKSQIGDHTRFSSAASRLARPKVPDHVSCGVSAGAVPARVRPVLNLRPVGG